MSSYIQISGTPRTPWAEEALTVDGTLRHPDATKTAGSLMARARLQGGPIRIQMLTAPTSTVGTPLYDADVVEWAFPELAALVATGGLILDSAGATATLWIVFYR